LQIQVPEKQADKFGRLVIQDDGGRMKPINTFRRLVDEKKIYEDMKD
jgi:hypothetical protein